MGKKKTPKKSPPKKPSSKKSRVPPPKSPALVPGSQPIASPPAAASPPPPLMGPSSPQAPWATSDLVVRSCSALEIDLTDTSSARSSPATATHTASVKDAPATVPEPVLKNSPAGTTPQSETKEKTTNNTPISTQPKVDSWKDIVKGSGKQLQKKGTGFTLPSGEACIKIPNSVIEKNQKSWECFVIGQFYSDPPSQGTLHNIVNGIWSKYYRDITVSKMDGFAFLFRIPNATVRKRVLHQRLWQIEGQTMFVANWEPGLTPTKPELSSAPIWLELRNVPFQFFNEDGLERIAGLVGEPKFLHPATAAKTNLEVAKVFTIIGPREPLPEAVNVQFDSGEITRVLVSSPWMPPICEFCKEIGHCLKRCKKAPITCKTCNSTSHLSENCQRAKPITQQKIGSRRNKARLVTEIWKQKEKLSDEPEIAQKPSNPRPIPPLPNEKSSTPLVGEGSGLSVSDKVNKDNTSQTSQDDQDSSQASEVAEDSSDVSSEDSDTKLIDSKGFIKYLSKRQKKAARSKGSKQV